MECLKDKPSRRAFVNHSNVASVHSLTIIPVGGEIARTPSGQNGSYRPGKPLLDQRVNSSLRFRSV